MKAFIVKRRGETPKAFIEEYYIGLVSDPEEHIRSLAMEALYEGIPKEEWSKKKVNSRKMTNVTLLEIENE